VKAATLPVQRPRDARLLVVDAAGRIAHRPRSALAELLVAGDLVVANDAATLPASLAGRHIASGATIEVRLAGRASLAADDVRSFVAVVFGAGDHRTPTERRPLPPPLAPGDALALGPLHATVVRLLDHPRLVELRFAGDADAIRAGIARHGRPVQYAHLAAPLALWDVWTRIAALPVAFEAPSAGFVLDWQLLDRLARRGVGFATLTHAAGLSSTGDAALDARLPLDEPYRIPAGTAAAFRAAEQRGGRVVALGTTVARALEHAAAQPGGLAAGAGVADNRLGAATRLAVVDAIVSGTHEPGTSHHDLLRAFVSAATLARVDAALETAGYRTHEFGDSIYVERGSAAPQSRQKRALGSWPADPHAAHERSGEVAWKRSAVNSALTMPVGTASVPQPTSIISEAINRPSPVLGVMSPKPTVVMVEIAQ
jgi:S-adenosylmethionine:tRNA ribosyltransferase-isomerase